MILYCAGDWCNGSTGARGSQSLKLHYMWGTLGALGALRELTFSVGRGPGSNPGSLLIIISF